MALVDHFEKVVSLENLKDYYQIHYKQKDNLTIRELPYLFSIFIFDRTISIDEWKLGTYKLYTHRLDLIRINLGVILCDIERITYDLTINSYPSIMFPVV